MAAFSIRGKGEELARPTFGFTRQQDDIIIRAVKQPGANPNDAAFWERLSLTV